MPLGIFPNFTNRSILKKNLGITVFALDVTYKEPPFAEAKYIGKWAGHGMDMDTDTDKKTRLGQGTDMETDKNYDCY